MSPRRAPGRAIAATIAATLLSGCGGDGVPQRRPLTPARLANSVDTVKRLADSVDTVLERRFAAGRPGEAPTPVVRVAVRCRRRTGDRYVCVADNRYVDPTDLVREPYDVVLGSDGCWTANLIPTSSGEHGSVPPTHFDPPPGGFPEQSGCLRG